MKNGPVADQGFPRGRSTNPNEWGAQRHYLTKFSCKPHGNEENHADGGCILNKDI